MKQRRASPEEIQAVLQSLDEMRNQGSLPPESYYKCIVTMASECLCNQGDQEQALVLLNRCPSSYFIHILPEQVLEDEMFADTVIELSFKIVQYGIINVETQPPTQSPAQA